MIKIMVVEKTNCNCISYTESIENERYQVFRVEDAREAIPRFLALQPDLVLVDICSDWKIKIPICQQIANLRHARYVPILLLVNEEAPEFLHRRLDTGPDDYIRKPVSQLILSVRINSALRFKAMYETQYQQRLELEQYQNHIEMEQRLAASLYEKIITNDFHNTPVLDYLVSPMAMFNGDLLLSGRSPSGKLNIMLGDFTGHGMAASIGVGPTADIFYGMTAKGFEISEIASEINRKLHKILPVEVFLASSIVSYEPNENIISICTGGLPEHYLYNVKTGVLRTISSTNLPLGIVSSESYKFQIQNFDVGRNDRLYLFSDGVIEAKNGMGQQFGLEGVRGCLENPQENLVETTSTMLRNAESPNVRNTSFIKDIPDRSFCQRIRRVLDDYRDGALQQDDITVAEIRFDQAEFLVKNNESAGSGKVLSKPMRWKVAMEFHADVLKSQNPVPLMINMLMEIQGLSEHREVIFTVVTELFVNALDHGLLLLDSNIKSTTEGFLEYFDIREKRLEALEEGLIKIEFDHYGNQDSGRLEISIEDSGPGFSEDKINDKPVGENTYSGRGIQLIKKLCESVDYYGCRNSAKAVYVWSR